MTNITKLDIMTPIRQPIREGVLFVTEREEKIACAGNPIFQEAFILHQGIEDHICHIWNHIWFKYYGFIPSYCLNCYKVVVRLRTLTELFELYRIQQDLDRPGKCGIENRGYVDGLYGGYFYNVGIEEGRECYRLVREAVSKRISPDVSVILKRACTEYELIKGPSDKWERTEEESELEARLNEHFIMKPHYCVPSKHRRAFIVNIWVEWAAMHGDETYLKYTNGKPLAIKGLPKKPKLSPLVTYHDTDPSEI